LPPRSFSLAASSWPPRSARGVLMAAGILGGKDKSPAASCWCVSPSAVAGGPAVRQRARVGGSVILEQAASRPVLYEGGDPIHAAADGGLVGPRLVVGSSTHRGIGGGGRVERPAEDGSVDAAGVVERPAAYRSPET